MTSLLTEDCSGFLPPQHRTLDHRLFEDVSVAQQDPLPVMCPVFFSHTYLLVPFVCGIIISGFPLFWTFWKRGSVMEFG